MEDMIPVSLDDQIIEPPNMFDQHLTADQKQFAPGSRMPKRSNNRYCGAIGLVDPSKAQRLRR
jgi:hypothetical protein